MYYISLDLEWNQAYPEKLQAVQKRLGARLRGEVIQIGAVKLNERMRICGSYSVIVRPQYFTRIHRHVRDLTGITQDMMDGGVPLREAAENFHRWCGEDFAFLTWGPDDIPMLKDNLRVLGVETAWLDRIYDLQPIFNQQTDGVHRQRSLEYAMEHFGIVQTLPAHDALNDAYFTALVAARLDLVSGIADYTARRGQFLEETDIGNADAGGEGYEDVRTLLAHPAIVHPVCPLCGAPCRTERLLHSKGQKYSCLIECEQHGQMMLRAKLQHNFNDTLRLHKSVVEADEESVETYHRRLATEEEEKKARPRRRRRRRAKAAAPAPGSDT